MIKDKKNFAPWLCCGILFWIVFKNPFYMLVFLALGALIDKKKNKKEEKDNNEPGN